MLQRTKNGAGSRLSVVPADAGQEAVHGPNLPVRPVHEKTGGTEAKGPLPQQDNDNAATKSSLKTALKANRKRLLLGAGLVALLATGWFGYDYVTVGRFMVSTDDAYVHADTTTLAAKVPGYVSQILVADNATVHAGDVIARIDNGDYKIAVDQARTKAATQQASIERFDRQIVAQQASVEQAQAQLVSSKAGQTRAQLEYQRQQALAGKAFASRQTLEQSIANRDEANASVQSAQAALDAAIANVGVLQAQKKEAERTLDELKTVLAKAERDFSFTEIRAPVDGVVGNRAAQVGDYVQTGQRVAAIVPLTDVYVDANFKETQLANVQPGQPVTIAVDALPDQTINGVVESLSPASGSVFSLLPPDNATGNFTKIVQRLGVRIRVPVSVADRGALRPGMSVVVDVDTKPGAVAAIPLKTRTAAK